MLLKSHLKKITTTITLIGESGTGKSSLARSIHLDSPLSNYKFLQVNVASLSKSLFESELFGHMKGSFTGAHSDKKGLLEEIGRGTLFLDEISDLGVELQAKLLTVLEEKEFYAVGSSTVKKFHGRIIFAANEQLDQLVDKGKMRFDFYQRIKTFTYQLEPLRKIENRQKLILECLNNKKVQYQNFSILLSSRALNRLVNYDFPGNFRELHSILEYIIVLGKGRIEEYQLPISTNKRLFIDSDKYSDALAIFEKKFLEKMLKKYHYGINITSEKIQISKVTLISKIKKYGINIKELKEISRKAS